MNTDNTDRNSRSLYASPGSGGQKMSVSPRQLPCGTVPDTGPASHLFRPLFRQETPPETGRCSTDCRRRLGNSFTGSVWLTGLLILFLSAAGISCQSLKSSTDTNDAHLEGTVQDPDETPLAGITVSVNERETLTDANGRFLLEAGNGDPGHLKLQLHGPEGTGQYRIDPGENSAPLLLEYPVITKVILLHDNDLHFNFNHRHQFESTVQQIREEYDNVWLLNAGDTFVRHAHRWAIDDTSYYDEMSRFMIETMNQVGYDVSAPGNHEIDYVGKYTGRSLRMAAFPFLAANIDIATTKLPQLKPFTVFETTNGLSIAILGHSTVNFDKAGVSARNPVETTRAYLNLGDEHDLFVALTHIGINTDRELAQAVPELDVIVGGHSHTLLEEAEMVNGVLVAQAGGPPPQHQVDPDWPKYLGKIEVILVNGEVVKKSGRVILIESPATAGVVPTLLLVPHSINTVTH